MPKNMAEPSSSAIVHSRSVEPVHRIRHGTPPLERRVTRSTTKANKGHDRATANGSNDGKRSAGDRTNTTVVTDSVPPIKAHVSTGYLSILVNFIDNFAHGVAIAASFRVGLRVSLSQLLSAS